MVKWKAVRNPIVSSLAGCELVRSVFSSRASCVAIVSFACKLVESIVAGLVLVRTVFLILGNMVVCVYVR